MGPILRGLWGDLQRGRGVFGDPEAVKAQGLGPLGQRRYIHPDRDNADTRRCSSCTLDACQ